MYDENSVFADSY